MMSDMDLEGGSHGQCEGTNITWLERLRKTLKNLSKKSQ
jgi:hypothetical protein